MPSNLTFDEYGAPTYVEGADDVVVTLDGYGMPYAVAREDLAAFSDHNDVYRSVDGGASWELVASGLPLNATITDPECLAAGETLYRVTAVSTLPSSSAGTTTLTITTGLSTYLSGGDAFTQVARMYYKPEETINPGLADREIVYFSGRSRPVALEGEATSLTINASATLPPDRVDPIGGGRTTLEAVLRRLAQTPGRVLYRDPTGRRVYGRITSMQVSEGVDGVGQAQFTVVETEEV